MGYKHDYGDVFYSSHDRGHDSHHYITSVSTCSISDTITFVQRNDTDKTEEKQVITLNQNGSDVEKLIKILQEIRSYTSAIPLTREIIQWTPVSEGMPPFDGFYLCYGTKHHECGNITKWQQVIECKMNHWAPYLYDSRVRITHWAFTPEDPDTKDLPSSETTQVV